MRLRWLLFAAIVPACTVVLPEDAPPPDGVPPMATAPTASGIVQTPIHGSAVRGDPRDATIAVSGVSTVSGQQLAVQVLANPADLTSWTTIATATADQPAPGGFEFAVDIQPTVADPSRWPAGGVLRLRVLDGNGVALPYDQDPQDTVVAVTNSSSPPQGWTYLGEKGVGSPDETDVYYQQIGAPQTLDAFIASYGFANGGVGEASATYYNAGDLGIGRQMHCQSQSGGGLACYVRNFGQFGGAEDDALAAAVQGTTPFATVAMVFTPPITAPNAVSFMVFGADDQLQDFAQLDTTGFNESVPQNCINCHGGRGSYDTASRSVTGARFLAFDPSSFDFATQPGFALADQNAQLAALDRLVANAAPTDGAVQLIEGMYPGATFDSQYVPPAWNQRPADARVYRDVIAPYCRSCHISQELTVAGDPLELLSPFPLHGDAQKIGDMVCGSGRAMPAAEATAERFFASGARGELLVWLNLPGACAP